MLILEKLYFFFHHMFDQFHQKKFIFYCASIFFSSIFLYTFLILIKRSKHRFISTSLRQFLFINADKSDSNALQIGGLVFSLVSMISITLLFSWFPYLLNPHQWKILELAYSSWIGILIYGYLDDRFEIRPIVKLTMQMGIIFIFCLRVSNVVFHENSALAFTVLVFFATAVVNGSNLIDGLDTLSYKISSVIYFCYIILAAPVMNLPAFFIATTCFFNMTGFYFFNREPSKIHLGEIGASSLGFSYVILSVLIFDSYENYNPVLNSLTKAIFPCSILVVELSVSFLRRILNNKSPFKGDKLHLHHILHEIKGFSASMSSTILAAVYFILALFCLIMMDAFSSIVSFILLFVLTCSWYLLLGKRYWFSSEIKFNLKIFEKLLVKKEVRVISSNALSDFRIIINKQMEEELNDE